MTQDKDELIRNHSRIKLTEIDVLRRLNLTFNDCFDEGTIRRFCASNKRTLPDMIELEVLEFSDDHDKAEAYQWHINVYENPNEREGSADG